MAQNDSKKRGEIISFMSPPGTSMYPWVFEANPEKDDQGKIWYQIMLKWRKEDVEAGGDYEEEFKEMRRAFAKAMKQGLELSVYESFDDPKDKPDDFVTPLRDGDKFNRANNKKRNEELFGHYYMNFKSENAPEVADVSEGGLQTITSKQKFYPGVISVASGVCGPFNNKGNEGVYVRLTNVCKISDGKRIGGKPSAKSQFEKFAKSAPKRNAADDGDDLL